LLDRELAYDDGTAEWAAGLSQRSGQLAYRFIASKPDAITEVDFYFPEFNAGVSGQTFTLIIWDNLDEGVEGRLLVEQHIVQPTTGINQFNTYKLGRPVAVTDTFYVGYEQVTADFFPVGLDKNTDSGSEIFINTDGVWEENDQITGSLMIRPSFRFKSAVGIVEEVFRDISLYPNPNNGRFYIRGKFEKAMILDTMGRHLGELNSQREITEFDLSDQPVGMYFIRILKDRYFRTYKVIIK
jgi:hypothetical protein